MRARGLIFQVFGFCLFVLFTIISSIIFWWMRLNWGSAGSKLSDILLILAVAIGTLFINKGSRLNGNKQDLINWSSQIRNKKEMFRAVFISVFLVVVWLSIHWGLIRHYMCLKCKC